MLQPVLTSPGSLCVGTLTPGLNLGAMTPMLDLTLAVVSLLLVLGLRARPLRRLRAFALPLVLAALTALAHLVAVAVPFDSAVVGAAEVALVLALAFLTARCGLMLLFDWVLVRRMGFAPPRLMREVLALVVYVVLALAILHGTNVEITGLVTTSAVITIVVGLALQQTLGNLLAGLALAWEQRIVPGTWVDVDGETALIEETGWRSLIARNRLGERVLVPNSDVGAARVTNFGNGDRPAAVSVTVGIAYSVSADAAKQVLLEVAAGDLFGEMAFLTGSARTATVRAADSALEVVEIGEAGLSSLLADRADLAGQLAEKVAVRRLQGEELRDQTGALISPAELVTQLNKRLLKMVGLGID